MKPEKNKNSSVGILIAEDSRTQAEQLVFLLEQHGYQVTVASNGKLALQAAQAQKPALIISDIVMPEMGGYELCKAVKSDEKLKDIPVILVTTLSDSEDVIRGLECGADNFLRKPYDEHYLLSRINYLLMNLEMRSTQKMQMGMEIKLGNQKFFINSERQQILDLLISTYEQAVHINNELKQREVELEYSNRVLNGFGHIVAGLNHAVTEREVAETALERAVELPGIQAGWISLWDKGSGFRLAATRNMPPALLREGVMEGLCNCQRRFLAGKLDHVSSILECERLKTAKGDTRGLHYHASVPLWAGDRGIGVMNLVGAEQHLFDEQELKMLYVVGNQVAVALERASLHEHLGQLVEERTAALTAEIAERKRIQEEQARLVAIIEATPDFVATGDIDGHVRYMNRAGLRMVGFEPGQDLSMVQIAETHTEWAANMVLQEGIPQAIKHGTWSGETALLHRDGHEIPVSQVIIAHKGASGSVDYLSTIARDITKRKANEARIARLNRIYSVLSGINNTIVRVREEDELFREVCRIAVEHGGFIFAWVGKLDANNHVVTPVAQAGRDDGYLAQINLTSREDIPGNCALTALALTGTKPVICNDIAGDERMAALRDAALSRGYRSVVALPLMPEGKPDGLFVLYAAETGVFDDEEMRLLVEMSSDIGYALENFRSDARREKAEAELRKLSLAVEQSPSSIVITDLEANIEYVNEGFVKTTGYSREEVIGRNPSILHSGKTPQKSYDDMWAHLARGEIWKGEFINRRKDGSEYVESIFISPVRDADGRMTHYLAIKEDITEHKLVEEAVRKLNDELEGKVIERTAELQQARIKADQANHAKSSFLATMSHEIRTPLSGMMGMLELLSLTSLDSEQRATLNVAWDSGRGLLRIVSDILDWSKIEEGKFELSPRPTSIPQLLQEVVNTYSRVASSKSLVLRQYIDAHLSPAHIVDPLRLSQVLNNFTSNALKFTSHGAVELRAELLEQFDSGEQIRFSVKDTGIGIAKEAQERLFQRYQQESADTARMYGGTGLGLSICRRLAELMDGVIELKSEQGLGSVFSITLTLPVSTVPGQTIRAQYPEVEQRGIQPLFADSMNAPLVLAVDDHPVNRELLARQVKLLGLRAETAENGKAALSMWRERRFALVITDCHMPEMDGYEFSRVVRKTEAEQRFPRTPIIAWTANALAEESARCQAAGMDDMLVKPAALAQLRKTLEKWLPLVETGNGQPASSPHDSGSGQSKGPIDYAILKQVIPDSAEHIQVLHDFQSHLRADCAKLFEVLEQGDQANVESTAHRMKGSSRMVGAMHLAKACATIEQAAHVGDIAGARAAQTALDEAIRQFDAYLIKVVEKPGEST